MPEGAHHIARGIAFVLAAGVVCKSQKCTVRLPSFFAAGAVLFCVGE